LVVLIGAAFYFDDFVLVEISSWLIFGMLTLSLALVWGQGGISTFGQNALFGIGAYLYGIFAINFFTTTHETISALVLTSVAVALVALLLGAFMFFGKLSGMYIAIIPLAFSLVLATLLAGTAGPQFHVGTAMLGGYNGMTGIPAITFGLPWVAAQSLGIQAQYIFYAVLAVVMFGFVAWLMRLPFGRVIASIRENELRTELLGYDTQRYKLVLFTLGGLLAGLAGACFAAWGLFIYPGVFGLQQAAFVVIWFLVGGRRSLAGVFFGVALVRGFSSFLGTGIAESETPLILGVVLILLILVLPGGLAGLVERVVARFGFATLSRPRERELKLTAAHGDSIFVPATETWDGGENGATAAVVLEAVELTKAFDGVRALDGVSLTFAPRGIHCLIGPNGAGKSTFFNLLIGRYRPTGGTIRLRGQDITRLPPHRRARLGIGIKLQVPSLYTALSAWDNVWLAAYASTRNRRLADDRTAQVLAQVGLSLRTTELAGNLAHGQQQWLEIGVVLAASPHVILLDEPSAGMTRYETMATVDLVRSLGEYASVVVVEHDMEFVRRLDAPVTVFHQGRVLVQGTLESLRRDSRVLDVYLGREVNAAAR
jgi:branched-chain amino acid transport system permease protein